MKSFVGLVMFEAESYIQRDNLWKLRGACFFQVFGFGILWSFSSVWMKAHGIGETLIGLISSTHIAVAMLFGLFWGFISDRTARPSRIVFVGSVGGGLAIPQRLRDHPRVRALPAGRHRFLLSLRFISLGS